MTRTTSQCHSAGFKQSGVGRDKSLHALETVHRAEDDLARFVLS